MRSKSAERLALLALLGGATGIGFAPIFVRFSPVGPSATAFYRLLFALPVLGLATFLQSKAPTAITTSSSQRWLWLQNHAGKASVRICAVAGMLFAADLALWHWSLRLTSVANSTLLTNCAPFFVMLGARVMFQERITGWLVIGMAVASVGASLLVGASLQLTTRHLVGDLLALATAVFYGGYLLSVKHLRISLSAASVLTWSGLVSCALLLLIAFLSREPIRITSLGGLGVLLSLGLVSHIGGQGLIAYALAHLPAGFSSVSLLLQPVVAALLAWAILSEPLTVLQGIGGSIVLIGIALASLGRK